MKKINMEKLKQYLEEEKIMEFESDEACRRWFNTYDYQNFLSVNQMKEYQGKYGFNIGEKRYHINYDDALDVWVDVVDELPFTDDELYILSDGMLALIRNTSEAAKLVFDSNVIKAVEETCEKYKELNTKICMMLE